MRCGRRLETLASALAVLVSLSAVMASPPLPAQGTEVAQPISVGGGTNLITGISGSEAHVRSLQEVTAVSVVPATYYVVAGQFDASTSFNSLTKQWQITVVIKKSGYGAIVYTVKDGRKGFFLIGPPPNLGAGPLSYTTRPDAGQQGLEITITTDPEDPAAAHYFVYIPNWFPRPALQPTPTRAPQPGPPPTPVTAPQDRDNKETGD